MKKLLFALMVVAAMAAHASVWYVSPTGSDETGTGGSDAPFATIANAVDRAGDGDVIRVAAGENGVASAITVAKGVTIVGEDGAIVCSTNALSSATVGDAMYSRSIFLLNHTDAVLTNLVICGKGAMGSPNDYGRGVTLNGGGYVLGCTVTNNYCKSGNYGSDGAGVCLRNGGTVRGCTISSNRAMMGNGGNVCISTSGLVENCVIESGNNDGSNGIRTGGAYMTGGTLRYCLLRFNRGSSYGIDRGADIFASGGTVDHCTVTANANGSKASAFGATYFEGSSTVVSNCIFYGNACPDWKGASPATFTAVDNLTGDTAMPGEGNLVADPWFVDAANGDYRVRPGPGAGKGYLPDAVGATVPDCGAYVATRNGTIDTDTVTLTAVLTGAAVGDTTFTWTVSNRTSAAVQTVSGTGADYATCAFTCGAGLYDVTLAVDATGVGSASRTFEGLFRVSSSVLRPTAGVLNALSDAILEAAGGTTIILANGWYTYEGTIMLDKKITIVSENGPEKTHVVALCRHGDRVRLDVRRRRSRRQAAHPGTPSGLRLLRAHGRRLLGDRPMTGVRPEERD